MTTGKKKTAKKKIQFSTKEAFDVIWEFYQRDVLIQGLCVPGSKGVTGQCNQKLDTGRCRHDRAFDLLETARKEKI